MPFLEIKGVSKHFGGVEAIRDLNFDVTKGEVLGVIGPNGAGKTTLFNLISGFQSPEKGTILFEDREITRSKPHVVAKRGVVRTFQSNSLFKSKTVFENVLVAHHLQSKMGFWSTLFKTPGARREETDNSQRAIEILEYLGLGHLRDELAKNLSHGYQRTLGIAVAMAARPKLLMLDEPMTGMNPEEITNMVSLIKGIRNRGTTVLLVEHNMRAVMTLCDRIVVLNHGEKIAEGSPQEIRENRSVIEAYLGTGEDAT
jgi:branched-chain amino acid transport system ATP-binding protein